MSFSVPSFACAELANRALLVVDGEDRKSFLQGLISNDTTKLTHETGLYALFLTPQGRFVHDIFLVERGNRVFIDAEKERADSLLKKLTMYRLRAQVSLAVAPEWRIFAAFGEQAADRFGLEQAVPGTVRTCDSGWALLEPRLARAGVRLVLPADAPPPHDLVPFDEYDVFRLSLGLPDGSRDLPVEKAIPLENGMEELNAIDWQKGCYLGQELTARTHYRGLVRKRLLPVRIEGPSPVAESPVLFDGEESGIMHSSQNGIGLALLRLEHVKNAESSEQPFTCGTARLFPFVPEWMKLPESDETTP